MGELSLAEALLATDGALDEREFRHGGLHSAQEPVASPGSICDGIACRSTLPSGYHAFVTVVTKTVSARNRKGAEAPKVKYLCLLLDEDLPQQ